MNDTSNIVYAQVEALVRLVDEHRQERCREILAQARRQAAKVVKEAHAEARQRLHGAVAEERALAHGKLASTRAQLQTRRRQRRQRADILALQKAWTQLHEALLNRWQDEASRRLWVQAAVRQALALLPAKGWRIEHRGGHAKEQRALEREIKALAGQQDMHWVEAGDIAAGIRVRCEGACLDATLAGLLANRAAIEAQLLAEIKR